jgi:energy-converting hydrogenase Eha subunit E
VVLLPDALSEHRKTLTVVYYVGAVVLIVVGSILWATGHGTGDPYLTVGIALAVLPLAVIWIRRFFGRG